MSNHTDTATIQQTAMNVMSQRQQRIAETKQQQEIEENNKDIEMIFEAFNRIRERGITNTKELTWEIMYKENKYKNNTINDEKEKENQTFQPNTQISQLIDESKTEMCKLGHGNFEDDKEGIADNKCIICQSMNEREYCIGCFYYDYDSTSKSWDDIVSLHVYCKDCRVKNAERIKSIIKMNTFKSETIRHELLNDRSLEMDLLCNMPRKASVDTLIADINKLNPGDRGVWSLFLFDLDHLKCWNTAIGHQRTDLLIKTIGNVFKKYMNEINNGIWNEEEKGDLEHAYVYRTGGDEFVMAVASDSWGSTLGPFYFNLRKNINCIGLNICELIFDNNLNEWNKVKIKLNEAKDRNNNPV
eukprot:479854_1